MTDLQFVNQLVVDAKLVYTGYPWNRWDVVGTSLSLDDDNGQATKWNLWTTAFSIHVYTFKNLQEEWAKLDWTALEKEAVMLNEKFRNTPDW